MREWLRRNPGRIPWGEFYPDAVLCRKMGQPEDPLGLARRLGISLVALPPGRMPLPPPGPALDLEAVPLPGADLEPPVSGEGALRVFALLEGPVQYFSSWLSFPGLLRAAARDRARLARRAREYCGALLGAARGFRAAGVAGVVLADDLAGSQGPMFSPQLIGEVCLPGLADLVQGLPLPVYVHSDGDVRSLLPGWVSCGVEGIHSLDRSGGMDPARLVEEWPELVLWGAVSRPSLLGSPGPALEGELEALVALRREGALLIGGSSTGILDGAMDPASLGRMQEVLGGFGRGGAAPPDGEGF